MGRQDEAWIGMRSVLLGLIVVIAGIAAASAAELPNMKAKQPERYKTCTIDGATGFLIPGSGACVKLGGYITGGVQIGNRKQ
jgi:porin-like protein